MSSVGRKLLMALTGLGFVGFIIAHLAGNLFLYSSTSEAFNRYAYRLESLGDLKEIAEIGLFGLIAAHILLAISLKRSNVRARPQGYQMTQSKGRPSKSTPISRNMIVSGILLFGFLILHLKQFTFGPGEEAGYVTELPATATMAAVQTRDLHRLVFETFQNPLYVGIYVVAMLLLGAHLRHGFWSAFQSLGATSPKMNAILYPAAIGIAILLAGGFLLMPIYLHFVYR